MSRLQQVLSLVSDFSTVCTRSRARPRASLRWANSDLVRGLEGRFDRDLVQLVVGLAHVDAHDVTESSPETEGNVEVVHLRRPSRYTVSAKRPSQAIAPLVGLTFQLESRYVETTSLAEESLLGWKMRE
jgi:hypothetical protein